MNALPPSLSPLGAFLFMESFIAVSSSSTPCNKKGWRSMYRAVLMPEKKVIFERQVNGATINTCDFLALTHAIAYQTKECLALPIYSLNKTALGWVNRYVCLTSYERTPENAHLVDLISRAESFLRENDWSHIELRKWDSYQQGGFPSKYNQR